jgi:hypothetical protein
LWSRCRDEPGARVERGRTAKAWLVCPGHGGEASFCPLALMEVEEVGARRLVRRVRSGLSGGRDVEPVCSGGSVWVGGGRWIRSDECGVGFVLKIWRGQRRGCVGFERARGRMSVIWRAVSSFRLERYRRRRRHGTRLRCRVRGVGVSCRVDRIARAGTAPACLCDPGGIARCGTVVSMMRPTGPWGGRTG